MSICLLFLVGANVVSHFEPPITAVAFVPDGSSVVVGSQGQLRVHSWPERELVKDLPCSLDCIHDLAFAPNGRWLAVAGGRPAEFGKLEVTGWPSGEVSFTTTSHDDIIYAASWNSDSTRIATASHDRSVQLHDIRGHRTIRRLEGHSRGVKAVVFLGHDERLVSAGIDQNLRLWATSDGQSLRALNNHTKQVHDLAVRPGPHDSLPLVASVSDDRSIRLWQPTIGRMVRFARLKKGVPLNVVWTLNGRYLAASCSDGRVRVVDAETAAIVSDLPGVEGMAYSLAVHPRRGELVVGGENGRLERVVLPGVDAGNAQSGTADEHE